jgi:hypothetical protein
VVPAGGVSRFAPMTLIRDNLKAVMAFGYEYLMVYLEDICPSSLLLFVHNPSGSTKLRDYSSGHERQLKDTLTVAEVLSRTTNGKTRFYYKPYRTNADGVGYWSEITRSLNERWLPTTMSASRSICCLARFTSGNFVRS